MKEMTAETGQGVTSVAVFPVSVSEAGKGVGINELVFKICSIISRGTRKQQVVWTCRNI